MKKKILKGIGISIFMLALVANVQLALIDYGLGTNNIGYQLIAQTTGGGSSSDESSTGQSGYASTVLSFVTVSEMKRIGNEYCVRSRECVTAECVGVGSVQCTTSSGCGPWSGYTCSPA